jgi:hypothetical protein
LIEQISNGVFASWQQSAKKNCVGVSENTSVVFYVSEPIVRGTILVHEIGLLEQVYEPLGRSLRLEISVPPSQKLFDLLPNGAAQFYCFRTGLPPHGKYLCVG